MQRAYTCKEIRVGVCEGRNLGAREALGCFLPTLSQKGLGPAL